MLRLRRAALAATIVLSSSCVPLAAALVVALAAATSIDAATVVKMNVADLAARCDLAVEARVTSASATIDAAGRIGTDYALDVGRTFAGTHAARRTIRLPGGVLPDGRGLAIPGMPVLAVGESAILFLSAENQRGERLPIGLAQGRMRIVTAADGTRSLASDLAGLELVDATGRPLPHPSPSAGILPYAATVQRIQAECARRAETRSLREPRERGAKK
jgi:hypothetical protein